MEIHPFEPVIDENCKLLILGSFPSVASRSVGFYYGHKQNRFWQVLSAIYNEPVPSSISGKKEYLLRHHIGLWDVLAGCDISGSADAAIKNPRLNNISGLIKQYGISKIYFNGAAAYNLFQRINNEKLDAELIKLPSTSPANASYNLSRLIDAWKIIKV